MLTHFKRVSLQRARGSEREKEEEHEYMDEFMLKSLIQRIPWWNPVRSKLICSFKTSSNSSRITCDSFGKYLWCTFFACGYCQTKELEARENSLCCNMVKWRRGCPFISCNVCLSEQSGICGRVLLSYQRDLIKPFNLIGKLQITPRLIK